MSQQSNECPICLQALQKGAALFTTACGHQFHFACIKDSVAHGNFSCPMCRGGVQQLMQQPTAVPRRPFPPPQVFQAPVVPPANFVPMQRTVLVPPPPAPVALVEEMPEEGPEVGRAVGEQGKVGVEFVSEVREVLYSESLQSLHGMISIAAMLDAAQAQARGGLDLVAVLDTSGSMAGAKIELVKQSLKYVMTQLTGRDRVSVITFSTFGKVVCGLTRMGAAGAETVGRLVDGITVGGGTNIWSGLAKGLELLQARKHRNPVCTAVVLTDGQDASALAPARAYFASPAVCNGLTLHTFGFGRDHDAATCTGLAELGHGTFNYVESTDQLGPAFATTLGGLLSIVAQDLALVITPASEGVTLVRALTSFPTVKEPTGALRISMPDIYGGERRDVVVEVALTALPEARGEAQPVANVHLTYSAAPTFDRAHPCTGVAQMTVLRPPKVMDTSRNVAVAVQRLRINAAETMNQAIALAQANHFQEASDVLRRCENEVLASGCATDKVCVSILESLRECHRRAQPAVFNTGGRAHMQSVQMAQAQQRATTSPSGGATAALYTTAPQQMQQASWANWNQQQQMPQPPQH